ncbi:hypothetical protein [Streptomyces sp. NRRL F-2580]|uniref:hypothetical protein n=1 Tax=Streptomyces sp. NRRL F-2580 TaxID=1463841 RepID=UPI00131E31AC|nr:hypothetical protein [Streptomyces sp. NRRL F-2580]
MVNDRKSARGAGPGPRWSDLVAAAGQRPGGLVLDGELVVEDTAGQQSLEKKYIKGQVITHTIVKPLPE